MPVIQSPVTMLNEPTGLNAFGQGFKPYQDLLLQALLSGQFNRIPLPSSAQTPGTFNFPQGSQSPGEAAQIRQLGGVPTMQGYPVPATFQGRGSSVKFHPPTVSPMQLQQMTNLATLQKSQAEIAALPQEQALKKAQTRKAEAEAGLYEQGGVPLYTVNPQTGATQLAGMVNPKGKFIRQPTPTAEKVQAQTAVDSMLESLDEMERMLLEDPTRLIRRNIPFMEREFAAVVDQFDKEAAIAAGGKQLTATELQLIRKTRPTIQDVNSPEAIARKIVKLREIGLSAKARLAGQQLSQEPGENDFSQLSDEELRAIAAGQ